MDASASSSGAPSVDVLNGASNNGIVSDRSSLFNSNISPVSHGLSLYCIPTTSRLQQRSGSREREDDCWACLIIPITFWFFASMTLILGFYGSETFVLGPDSSRLLSANSLFVNDIEVQDNGGPGPMLYGFSTKPQLNIDKTWFRQFQVTLMPDYHQEWPIWLNKGSNVTLNYTIWSTGFFDILVAITKGSSGLNDWISDPMNPNLSSSWHYVHGTGTFTFVADEDADYFFALGNLNRHDVKVQLDLVIHGKLYNISNADYKCSLQNRLCAVKLWFPGMDFALLTTPDAGQMNQETWYIKLSFGQRWITYFLSLGAILGLAVVLLQMANKLHSSFREANHQQTPLLPHKETTAVSYGTMCQNHFTSTFLQDAGENGSQDENLYDTHTCVVCYDAPRTSFFDPCGHCVTCYPCGVRIQIGEITDSDEAGESGTCPICRTKIQQVRKIFAV